jgi:hypothetical protein
MTCAQGVLEDLQLLLDAGADPALQKVVWKGVVGCCWVLQR